MRGIVWFLVISFVPAWIMWEVAIQSGINVLSWEMQPFLIPGAFCPALAAFVVRKWITREGFADSGLRPVPRQWRYYLFAWLLPLGVVGTMLLEAMIIGLGTPDFSLARAISAEPVGRDVSAMKGVGLFIVPQVMLAAILTTPVLFGEEFGWRGYLQSRLIPGRPVIAAIATGIIWAVWHFPLTLCGYNYPDHPLLGSMLFTVLAVLLSYIFGWIYKRSGSIWANSLAHAATNTIGALAILWLAGAGGPIIISYGGLLALPPLVGVCIGLALVDRRTRARIGTTTERL